jgi:hypothetical protein
VCFHFGGEFIQNYSMWGEMMPRQKFGVLAYLLELKAHLSEHMNLKASMKYFFLFPGKEMHNGLLFLNDISKRRE